MGNACFFVDALFLEDCEEEWEEWEHVFRSINFSKTEFKKLYALFKRVDTDDSGLIDLKELCAYLNIQADVFLCRCFAIFDEDDSGFIDFGEFVLSLWNYCTHTPDSLMLFAYNLFNTNKTGHMTKEECLQMLHIVFRNGKALDKHTHKVVSVEEIAAHQAYTHIHTHIHNTTQDGEVVSFEQFEKLIKDYPEIVFPAFRLRHSLYKKVFGVKFWDRVSKSEMTLSDGRKMTVGEFKSHGMLHFRSILAENSDRARARTSSNNGNGNGTGSPPKKSGKKSSVKNGSSSNKPKRQHSRLYTNQLSAHSNYMSQSGKHTRIVVPISLNLRENQDVYADKEIDIYSDAYQDPTNLSLNGDSRKTDNQTTLSVTNHPFSQLAIQQPTHRDSKLDSAEGSSGGSQQGEFYGGGAAGQSGGGGYGSAGFGAADMFGELVKPVMTEHTFPHHNHPHLHSNNPSSASMNSTNISSKYSVDSNKAISERPFLSGLALQQQQQQQASYNHTNNNRTSVVGGKVVPIA